MTWEIVMVFGIFGLGPTELIILLILGLPVLAGIFFVIYWLSGAGKRDDDAGDE